MKVTTEEEDGVTTFSDVLMLSGDVLISGDGGEDSFDFGFTGENQNDTELLLPEASVPRDSTASPSRSNACTVDDKASRSNKRTGSDDGQNRVRDSKPVKKCKRDQKKPSVKKEKIGAKITALQHFVSPYDTTSVLHETMGYIKFLKDQVQVLSSPYYKHHPPLNDEDNRDINPTMEVKELKSNDLCLVPVAWTVHVVVTDGADLWSPAI